MTRNTSGRFSCKSGPCLSPTRWRASIFNVRAMTRNCHDWIQRAGYFDGDGGSCGPGHEISGPGWSGLRFDDVPYRAYNKDGYAGLSGAAFIAMANKIGTRTVVLIAATGTDDQALPLLIDTLRFID